MDKKQHPVLILLAFLAIYIIWGTTYVAILFGLEGFPPFLLSGMRFSIAGILLLGWCLLKKQKFPTHKDLKITIISGIVMLVGGSGLVAWAEQYIASGHAAIITATEPFMFLLLDKKRRSFYFSQKGIIAGLILGFIGIIIFFAFARNADQKEITIHLKVAGMLVLFTSALLWVIGSLYSKRKREVPVSNTITTAIQLIAAGIFSLLLSFSTGEGNSFSFNEVSLKAWGGLFYLTLLGSVVAYLAFTWLLTVRPAAQVSTHTYVNPVIAILTGWWIANEHIVLIQVLALGIILAGVLLTNKSTEHKI
ncbi:MAG: EamA family transporter [Ferruginibacter sp.]